MVFLFRFWLSSFLFELLSEKKNFSFWRFFFFFNFFFTLLFFFSGESLRSCHGGVPPGLGSRECAYGFSRGCCL